MLTSSTAKSTRNKENHQRFFDNNVKTIIEKKNFYQDLLLTTAQTQDLVKP